MVLLMKAHYICALRFVHIPKWLGVQYNLKNSGLKLSYIGQECETPTELAWMSFIKYEGKCKRMFGQFLQREFQGYGTQ